MNATVPLKIWLLMAVVVFFLQSVPSYLFCYALWGRALRTQEPARIAMWRNVVAAMGYSLGGIAFFNRCSDGELTAGVVFLVWCVMVTTPAVLAVQKILSEKRAEGL